MTVQKDGGLMDPGFLTKFRDLEIPDPTELKGQDGRRPLALSMIRGQIEPKASLALLDFRQSFRHCILVQIWVDVSSILRHDA